MFDDLYDNYEDDDGEDDDDDKDKKHRKRCRQQQMKSHFSNYNNRRGVCILVLVVLVIMFFVHAAPYTSPDVEIILDAQKMRLEKVERSSVILDVLRRKKAAAAAAGEQPQQSDNLAMDEMAAEEPAIPAFRLITEFKNGIYFYNIHEPIESWWPFDCLPTKMKQSINTMVCIHDPRFDKQVSQQLKENGMWEPTNVRSFLTQLRELNDTNVIDVGANIGIYSLLAAKLGRYVIAIEPLHENLNRMHKAAHLEGIQSKIIALVNAVAHERTQLKLSIMDYNIGGTYVLQPDLVDPEQKFSPTSSSVIVNSILLDDLVDVAEARLKLNQSQLAALAPNLRKQSQQQQQQLQKGAELNQKAKRRFIMKLDIEGFEPYVFEKAARLFDTYEIPAVFMEFGKSVQKLASQRNETSSYGIKIINMLEFFKSRNYEPYEVNGINKLDYSNWRYEWPWDVFFKKCDVIYCPNHTYRVGES